MPDAEDIARVAKLFKVLGNESRLRLLFLLDSAPHTVLELVEATGLSQPLVSQHLRTLREAGLATDQRSGRNTVYDVTDHHVTHLMNDAAIHTQEARGERY